MTRALGGGVLALVVLLSGCYKPALERVHTDSGEFNVERLFTTDKGCDVYRFEDAGRAVYFVTCPGSAQYSITRSTGKTTYTEHVESSTAEVSVDEPGR